ncbi:MAG TPA: TonB family protein, partial [Polyangia bacterium]
MPSRLRARQCLVALLILCAWSRGARAHDPDNPDGGVPPPPGLTTAPALIERVEPVYPEAARAAGLGATVTLELKLDETGAVVSARVVKPVGFGFDEAALAAARRLKFRPATKDGLPIPVTILFNQGFRVRANFSVESTADSAPPLPEVPPPAPGTSTPVYQSTVEGRGPSSAASAQTLRNLDFDLRPKTAPNDILRIVPGLLTVQHQGGGKADQLFLRGFDADHGTDVGVFVDGIPVNMPSHAHGQGYADLHWMIPEALDSIEVVKHPYDVRFGDFSTAGAVNLITRKDFPESFAQFTTGGFPTLGCAGGIDHCKLVAQERALVVVAPKLKGWASRLHPWIAAEVARDQGPFVAPENLERYNVFAKLTYDISPHSEVGMFFQSYGSQWIGSGQIPERAVAAGQISRFGAEDPSEGGMTQRQMLTFFFKHHASDGEFNVTAYVTRYSLALFNDFTFFLVNPVNGDELEQDDNRVFSGAIASWKKYQRWHGISFRHQIGASIRYDGVHIDLWDVESSAVNDGGMSSGGSDFRQRLGRRASADERLNMLGPGGAIEVLNLGSNDDISEVNLAAFAEEDIVWTRWLRTIAGLRMDYFGFNVSDQEQIYSPGAINTSGTRQESVPSPKASVIFTPVPAFDIYLNYGSGFHSNDARISVIPNTLRTADGTPIQVLPRFYAGEIGARYSYNGYFSAATAFWASYLQNEITIDSDVGQFSPGDPTERLGIDFELRAHPWPWLYIDYDLAYAHTQSLPDHANGGEIALAPKVYMTGGVSYLGTGRMR